MRPELIQQQLDDFIRRCKSRKLSVTHQRLAVFRALLRSADHPTADDIFQAVRREFPTISLATVYKALDTLEREEMIRKVSFSHEQAARYDANLDQHHHLFCINCHRVEDFYDAALDKLRVSKRKAKGYQVIDHFIQLNGICPACQKKMRTSSPALDK